MTSKLLNTKICFFFNLFNRYIQGATSPKNIIILIDASGSMHGVPMRIAKLSAQNLIDTFGDNDFFNVVYVSVLLWA